MGAGTIATRRSRSGEGSSIPPLCAGIGGKLERCGARRVGSASLLIPGNSLAAWAYTGFLFRCYSNPFIR